MSINQSGPNNYSQAQLQALLSEWQNDPYGLGYNAAPTNFLNNGNIGALAALTNFPRDGVNPSPTNNVLGPAGAITGATTATPAVITTAAAHGLANGDAVAIANVGGNTGVNGQQYTQSGVVYVGVWYAKVLSSTTFSIYKDALLQTAHAGSGTYTSGGTWQWCVGATANGTQLFNQFINAQDVHDNIAIGDCSAATAYTGTQAQEIAAQVPPTGMIRMTNAAGVENARAGWVNSLTAPGTNSRLAVKALETRAGSRGEQLLNIVTQAPPGFVLSSVDANAVLQGHY